MLQIELDEQKCHQEIRRPTETIKSSNNQQAGSLFGGTQLELYFLLHVKHSRRKYSDSFIKVEPRDKSC